MKTRRSVVAALIQAHAIRDILANLDCQEALIREAADRGAQIVCLQELCNTLFFPVVINPRWYDVAEPIPGPTTERMSHLAQELRVALVVPLYEEAAPGVYYNTAAVIDADGTLLGRYRKNHIPSIAPLGGKEKFYFKPGNLGYPVFETRYAKIGVYICYDRHFPEGARLLSLGGAEIIFIPSATYTGLSDSLWMVEPRSIAIANGCFVGAINRVGVESLGPGKFYGSSYFSDPLGNVIAKAGEDEDEVVVHKLPLTLIQEARNRWQFFRDRRPDTYDALSRDLL